MKNDIPQIVEDLYFSIVSLPDKKDWPEHIQGSEATIRNLYSFYYGLQMGFQLSAACQPPDLIF